MNVYYDVEDNHYRTYPDGDIATIDQMRELVENKNLSIVKLQQEYKQLKDNWNNLKEYLNEGTFYYKTGNGEYTTEMVSNRINGLDTLRKMQELEQGADK